MIKDHFTFSVREQRGIFILSVLILLLILLRMGMPYIMARRSYDFSEFEKQVQWFESRLTDTVAGNRASKPVAETYRPSVTHTGIRDEYKGSGRIQGREASSPVIDLNSTDSLALVRLKGIGPILAVRILKYREFLGGYYDVNQLKDVYGMDTNTVRTIKDFLYVDVSTIRKMDLNTATFRELLRHPYLEYEDVKRIVNYRDKHHPMDSLNELFYIEGLDPDLILRIQPYLKVGH